MGCYRGRRRGRSRHAEPRKLASLDEPNRYDAAGVDRGTDGLNLQRVLGVFLAARDNVGGDVDHMITRVLFHEHVTV